MADILVSADYDAIRVMLGNVPDTVLTDAIIEMYPFLPVVEITVKNSFPTWATIKAEGGDDWTLLKAGTACLTAYSLAMKMFVSGGAGAGSFSVGGYSETFPFASISWPDVLNNLLKCAYSSFSKISVWVLSPRPTLLIADGPSRDGYKWPTTYEGWIKKILPEIIVWELEEDIDAT